MLNWCFIPSIISFACDPFLFDKYICISWNWFPVYLTSTDKKVDFCARLMIKQLNLPYYNHTNYLILLLCIVRVRHWKENTNDKSRQVHTTTTIVIDNVILHKDTLETRHLSHLCSYFRRHPTQSHTMRSHTTAL